MPNKSLNHFEGTGHWSRRRWLASMGAAALSWPWLAAGGQADGPGRKFHVCLSPRIIEDDPTLLKVAQAAGVTKIWLAGYFYGHWPFAPELIARARQRVLEAGLEAGLITVPLGHPGDSLGARDGDFPLTPPAHWRLGERPEGKQFAGTSLHAPATEENAAALRRLRELGFRQAFVDDDFRLARGPGEIGGCFCATHREAFLREAGLPPARWTELLEDVRSRRLTPLLRQWVEWTCDQLTGSLRSQQRAWGGELGIMVMYLGAEKAGIRLKDYRQGLVRVGELMFSDAGFNPVKGKTDELFSALFHRQFVAPEKAYSESTAYPANQLSAANLAAKLVISTLADVRNTCFMSGLTPFPRAHWEVLGPAMRRQARAHEAIAGHRLQGPFKLVWGEAQRYVGDDQPFSLWLAMGVPFEVVTEPAAGWNFLADFDARHLSPKAWPEKTEIVCRNSSGVTPAGWLGLQESLPELFRFKRSLRPRLAGVPVIEEDVPAVCAWYPSAGKVLVWNLESQPRRLTVVRGTRREIFEVEALGTSVVEGFGG